MYSHQFKNVGHSVIRKYSYIHLHITIQISVTNGVLTITIVRNDKYGCQINNVDSATITLVHISMKFEISVANGVTLVDM